MTKKCYNCDEWVDVAQDPDDDRVEAVCPLCGAKGLYHCPISKEQ